MGLTRTRFSQANTIVARIQDPITVLNSESTVANVDVGFLINRDLGSSSNVALFWKESSDEFVTALTANAGLTDSNITVTSYANLRVGTFFGNIGGGNSQANTYISGSLIPSANVAYDLGTNGRRFRDLWLSGTTLHMGDQRLTVTNGEWRFTTPTTTVVLGAESTVGNLTVTGNLNLQGSSTTFDSNSLSIQDSIIELHTLANLAPLTGDDGRDIGLKFHYYKTKDEHAFLGWSNSTGYLEWYDSGREGVGNVFTGNTFGTIKSGGAILANTTPSTSTTTGALRVSGGVGIAGNLYITNTGDVSANIGTVKTNLGQLDANVSAYQTYANANAAAQASSITSLTSNAATQHTTIASLDANVGTISTSLSSIASGANANTAAYLLTATGNIAAGNLTVTGNIYGGIVPTAIYKSVYVGSTLVNLARGTGALTVDNFNTTGYAAQANLATLATNATKTAVTSNISSGTAYVTFVNATTGNVDQNISTALTYNPQSGNLRAYTAFIDTDLTVAGNLTVQNISYTNQEIVTTTEITQGNLVANSGVESTSNVTGAVVVRGGIGATGNVYTKTLYTLDGIRWAGNGNVFASGGGGDSTYSNVNVEAYIGSNIGSINANITAANSAIQTLSANIGTLIAGAPAALDTLSELSNALGNSASFSSTMVNWLGNITSNVTAANSSINTFNANLGAYQTFANANAATQATSIDTINANVGAFQTFSNANAATQAVSINTINANIGAYQTYANANVVAIQANLNAFYNYANTKIGTNTNSNLVVVATTNSTSTTTGALVVAGGAGIAGNVTANNFSVSSSGIAPNTGIYQVGVSGILGFSAGTYKRMNLTGVGGVGIGDNITSASLLQIEPTNNPFSLFSPTPTNSFGFYNSGGTFTKNGTYAQVNANSLKTTTLVLDDGVDPYSAGIATTLYIEGAPTSSGLTTITDPYALYVNSGTSYFGSILKTIGNIVAASTTPSTSTTTGALVVGGGVGIAGNVYADKFYTTNGLYWAGNGLAFSSGSTYSNANVEAYIGGNIGAYQTYANANAATQATSINTINANIGAFQIFSNANAATQATSINTINANIGAYQTYANANAATQATSINSIDANLGTATTNITTLFSNAASQAISITSLATGANANTAAYLPSVTTLAGLTSFGAAAATTTAQGSLTIVGNLTVQGNTLTIGSNNLTVTDSIIDLHTFANLAPLISDDGRDVGIRLHYYKTSDKHAFLGWENATEALTYYQDATETNGVVTGTLGNVELGSLYVSNTTPSTSTTTGALVVRGGMGIAGNIQAGNVSVTGNVTGTTFIFANGVNILSTISAGSTYSNVNVEAYIGGNIGAFQIFSNANAATQATSINTINANIGAFQIFSNSNAATQATSINTINANIGAFYTYANTKIGTNTNSNLVVVATTTSTSTTTGALVVGGGVGIAGNVYADKFYTTNGLYWAGNGLAFSSGGGTFTASNTAPTSPNAGDQWYYVASDILFEYINDGDSNQWVDTSSPTTPTSSVLSDLILANVSISSVYNINSTLTALGLGTTANLTIGNVITGIVTATGNVNAANLTTTGNVATSYLIATANVITANVVTNIVTATGNVNAANLTTTGNVVAGNLVTTIVTASANITASNVVTGIVTASGNITAANVTTSGNVRSSYYHGDGSKLTNTMTTGKAIAMSIVFGG